MQRATVVLPPVDDPRPMTMVGTITTDENHELPKVVDSRGSYHHPITQAARVSQGPKPGNFGRKRAWVVS